MFGNEWAGLEFEVEAGGDCTYVWVGIIAGKWHLRVCLDSHFVEIEQVEAIDVDP